MKIFRLFCYFMQGKNSIYYTLYYNIKIELKLEKWK